MGTEEDKKHWPKDSLKRALLRSFPGCKTALEALKSVINRRQNHAASQTPKKDKSSFDSQKLDNETPKFAPSSGNHKDEIEW